MTVVEIGVAIPDTVDELLLEAGDTYPGTIGVMTLDGEICIFSDPVRIPICEGEIRKSDHTWIATIKAIVEPLYLYDASGILVGKGGIVGGPCIIGKRDSLILHLTLIGKGRLHD